MFKKTALLPFLTFVACSRLAFAQNLPAGVHELALPLPPIVFDKKLQELGINLFDCEFAKNTVSAHTTASASNNPFTLVCILSHKKENDQDPISSVNLATVFIPLKSDGTYGQQQTLSTAYPQFRGYSLLRSYTNGTMLFSKYTQNTERRLETIGLTSQPTNEYLNPDVSTVMLINQNAYPVWQYEFFYDLQKDPSKRSVFYSAVEAETVSDGYNNGYVIMHYAPEWGEAEDYYQYASKYRDLFLSTAEGDRPVVPIVLDHLDAKGHRINTQQISVPIASGTRDAHRDFRLWPLDHNGYALSVHSVSVVTKDLPIDSSFTILYLNANDIIDHQMQIHLDTAHLEGDLEPERSQKMLVDTQGHVLLQTYDDTDGYLKSTYKPELTLYDTNGKQLWHQLISPVGPNSGDRVLDILETPQQEYLVIVYHAIDTNGEDNYEELVGILLNQKGEEVWRLPLLNAAQLKSADPDTPLRFAVTDNKLWIKMDEEVKTLSATAWQKILTSKGLLSENLGLHIYRVDLPK